MEFEDQGILLARLFRASELNFEGLTFYSLPDEGIQLGTWGYNKDQVLQPHNHNKCTKLADRTCEIVFVVQGSIHVDLYSETDVILSEFEMNQGDILICLGGGHGYQTLEDETKVLEFKNGPYFGKELDRRRFESRCQFVKSQNDV